MIRVLVFGALIGAFLGGGALTAQAADHPAELVDASPGVDRVVVRPPSEIALSFRETLESVRVRLFKDDRLLSTSDATIQGSLAVAPVESDGAGSYLVDWKGNTTVDEALAGAYVFVVDPRGDASVAVDRDVSGASGALGGLRVLAGLVATGGAITLLVGGTQWTLRPDAASAKRVVGIGATVVAIGAVAAAATYGVASDGAAGDLLDTSLLPAALASVPGRSWLTAALATGMLPFLIVLARSVRGRALPVAGTAVAVFVVVWVSVSLAWLLRVPWPLLGVGMGVAAGVWVSIEAGRPLGVIAGLAVGVILAVPIIQTVQGSGTSAAAQAGDLLMETSLDPARPGVNELHLYGFDVSGAGAALGQTSVLARHDEFGVGPMYLPVLRAGPNHFLSYDANLPFTGVWTLEVSTGIGEDRTETFDMVLELP
jgi:methionine-rich copper-binding protein CopC